MSQSSNSTKQQPSHHVLHVRKVGEKSYWTRIGAAWAHEDGKGFNVQVDIMPLNGELKLRVPEKK